MRHTLHRPTSPGTGDRFARLQRPCPACGQLGVRIVYGCPSGSLLSAAQQGKVLIGGCTHRPATHRCPNGHEWHSADAA